MNLLTKILKSLQDGWDILSTVYSYNSLAWRILKSGGLVVFGFFNLMMSNLIHSFKPHWDFLHFFMAYGSLLIIYGPIHHLVVIPGTLKLGQYSWARKLKVPSKGHQVMLVLFFLSVVYFGFFPLDVMTFELKATGLSGTPDVNPEISCRRLEEENSKIYCEVENEPGIARVDVESGGQQITTDDSAPFEFTVNESELKEVVGRKSFYIIPRDKNGNMLRRYSRQADLIGPSAPGDTAP